MPLAVLTLMSEANYEKLTAENRRAWITGTLILSFSPAASFHHYVQPFCKTDFAEV